VSAARLVAVSRGQFLALADEGQPMRNALRFFGEDNTRGFACYSYWVGGDVVYVGRTRHSVMMRLEQHFLSWSRCVRTFPIRVTWSTYKDEFEMEEAERLLIWAAGEVSIGGLHNVIYNRA